MMVECVCGWWFSLCLDCLFCGLLGGLDLVFLFCSVGLLLFALVWFSYCVCLRLGF